MKFSPVSYREYGLPVSENMLKQKFYASGPNQKFSGDITIYARMKATVSGCRHRPVVAYCYRLVNVTTDDCATDLRCAIDGVVEA